MLGIVNMSIWYWYVNSSTVTINNVIGVTAIKALPLKVYSDTSVAKKKQTIMGTVQLTSNNAH